MVNRLLPGRNMEANTFVRWGCKTSMTNSPATPATMRTCVTQRSGDLSRTRLTMTMEMATVSMAMTPQKIPSNIARRLMDRSGFSKPTSRTALTMAVAPTTCTVDSTSARKRTDIITINGL